MVKMKNFLVVYLLIAIIQFCVCQSEINDQIYHSKNETNIDQSIDQNNEIKIIDIEEFNKFMNENITEIPINVTEIPINTTEIQINTTLIPLNTTEDNNQQSISTESIGNDTTVISEPMTTPTTLVTETTTLTSTTEAFNIILNIKNETFKAYFLTFLNANPNAIIFASENYPDSFPAQYTTNLSISVDGGTGIEVIIHDLDIDPFLDTLYIRGGTELSNEQNGQIITGNITKPQLFRILHTTDLFIQFRSDNKKSTHTKRGFLITYSPFGEIRTTTTTEPTISTVPTSILESYTISLSVPKLKQIPETWNYFKELLAQGANKFIKSHNLAVENAKPDDVIFLTVFQCKNTWIDWENCVQISFSIPLAIKSIVNSTKLQSLYSELDNTDGEEKQYQLTTENLWKMWAEYGKTEFLNVEINEYSPPDTDYALLIWGSICLGVIIIFMMVLYSIWKMDFFRDYHLMHGKADDQKNILSQQSEIDISMFPSPHQIVPTFFPSHENYGGVNGTGNPNDNSGHLPYEYDSIKFSKPDVTNRRGGYYSASEITEVSDDLGGCQEISHSMPSAPRVSFAPNIIDFNEPRSEQNVFYPEDEISFTKSTSELSPSPRTKKKLQLRGSSKTESRS